MQQVKSTDVQGDNWGFVEAKVEKAVEVNESREDNGGKEDQEMARELLSFSSQNKTRIPNLDPTQIKCMV